MIAALIVAAAAGAPVARFELAVRGGGGIATGQYLAMNLEGASGTPKLDPFVPLWAEAGAHLSPSVVVAAFLQYAFGRADPGQLRSTFCASPVTCSSGGSHVVRVGGEVHYRFLQDAAIVPWIGAGAGYLSHSSQVDLGVGGIRGSLTTRNTGFDLNAQAGADVRMSLLFSLGAYAAAFTGESASVEAGLRVRFDLY